MTNLSSLPLLLALKNWTSAVDSVQEKPEGARRIDTFGLLPIHRACEGGAPLELIEMLIIAFPESIRISSSVAGGSTPLQFALKAYPRGSPVISLLQQTNNEMNTDVKVPELKKTVHSKLVGKVQDAAIHAMAGYAVKALFQYATSECSDQEYSDQEYSDY